jgi:hypothetical protein
MININLISSEKKEILKSQRFYFSLKEASVLFFLFISVISLILWVSYYLMEKQLVDLEIMNTFSLTANEEINQRIMTINKRINDVENIEKNFTYNHKVIEKISLIQEPRITYNQITLHNQQNILELYGIAENRESLLNFKKILENQDWINKIDLPLANLIEKENNQFTIKIEIIRDRL